MVMSIGDGKKVIVNGETFSFYDFRTNPEIFIPKIKHLFREKTLSVKENESYSERLNRIFYLLYYTKGVAAGESTMVSTNTTIQSSEFEILNALGIDVIKHCPATSKIVFKNSGKESRIKNVELEKIIQSLKSDVKFPRTKKSIKFGVELEFIAIKDYEKIDEFSEKMQELVGKDRYSCPLQYHHNNGNQWELGRDGSVRGVGKSGFELTSPILTYGNKADMEELKLVLELIKKVMGGSINKTCGTHVHMSFNCGLTSYELKQHFALSYHISESTLFDKVVPITRREDNNRYCQSVCVDRMSDRYQKLNLCHVKNDSNRMHLEFRQLDGTLDYDKLISWIKLQKLFIETTLSSVNKSKKVQLKLEDVLCDKSFDSKDIETLLSMSSIAS